MSHDIHLDVPFVTQMKIGAHAGGNYWNDTTGCWYAAVCMISYYYEAGPRKGVPAQYTINKFMRDKNDNVIGEMTIASEPIGARYDELMKNEGLESIELPSNKKWNCEQLCRILETKGPCYIRRGFRNKHTGALEGGHAIVMVGCEISTQSVFFHCPTLGPNRKVSIAEFNDMFKWDDPRAVKFSMMYKPKKEKGRSVSDLIKNFNN